MPTIACSLVWSASKTGGTNATLPRTNHSLEASHGQQADRAHALAFSTIPGYPGNSRSISRRRPMKTSSKWHLAVLAVGLAVPTAAFSLEAGTREGPAKEILVPAADAWKLLINTRADQIIKTLPGMREKFGVKSEQVTIAGVNCYMLTPDNILEQNRDRLLVHVHGGGYVFAPAEAAT